MKRFSILSIVGLLTLSLQSCFFSEDDIFGENHDIGGVVLLLHFEGENVTIMSDKSVKGMDDPDSIRAGEQVTSKFSLLADQSTVLSFSTYNSLIHYWSEPKGRWIRR